jgi:hypothetical protein
MTIEKKYIKYNDIIEDLANQYQHTDFAYLSSEDIKQEIRIICANALKQFREGESSIKTYLSRCILNRLGNLKRDVYFRIENPCKQKKCPMYSIFDKKCTSKTYPDICEEYQKSVKKMQSQINIVNTAPIENVDGVYKNNSLFDTETQDLSTKVRKELVNCSGGKFGRCYDELIFYGDSLIDKDIVDFIKKLSLEIING